MEVIGRISQMIVNQQDNESLKSKGNQLRMKNEHCKLIFQ